MKIRSFWAGAFATAFLLVAGTLAATTGQSSNAQSIEARSLSTWCSNQSKAFILGDSTATGYGTSGYTGGNGSPYMATTNGWWATLTNQFPSTQWTNLARNGALTSDFLPAGVGIEGRGTGPLVPNAIDLIQSAQPSVVIVMLGANEYGTDRRPEQVYKTNLTQLVNRIRTVAPQTSLLFVHTWEFDYRWATGSYLPYEYNWGQYAAAMESVVNSLPANNVDYLDLTKYLPKADNDTAGLYITDEYGSGNPVHAANAGNWAIRAAVQGALSCN